MILFFLISFAIETESDFLAFSFFLVMLYVWQTARKKYCMPRSSLHGCAAAAGLTVARSGGLTVDAVIARDVMVRRGRRGIRNHWRSWEESTSGVEV
jgi:hypothetical protein